MRTTEKKTETITIRITKETAEKIAFNAREERRKPAELVALWVEDMAEAETLRKVDKGAEWSRPVYTLYANPPKGRTAAELMERENLDKKGEANR